MSSGRKNALIGRFSRASTVAPTVTAHWKANQHRQATAHPHPTRSQNTQTDLPWVSNGRRTRFYGTICVLYGIELRGDGGTNGSHESRELKLAEPCCERIEKPEGWADGPGGGVDVGNHGGRFGTRGGGFLRGLERKDARPKRRRHLARHRLFRKCAVGVLYPATGVRSRNAPAQKEGIGD